MKTRITTDLSVWLFDHSADTYTREPRNGDLNHPSKPYAAGPVPFTSLWWSVLDRESTEFSVVVTHPDGVITTTIATGIEVERSMNHDDPGCMWHGDEPVPDKYFRLCLECGHVFVTRDDLIEAHRQTTAGSGIEINPADAHLDTLCGLCTHDFAFGESA